MAAQKNVLGLIDAGREVRRPPWSGCNFFMSVRWACPISVALAPAARQGSDRPPLQSFLPLQRGSVCPAAASP